MTTFLDVGANRGEWTRSVLQSFPSANVFSLEILPSTFTLLQGALGSEPRAKLFNIGLADRAGVVEVNASLDNDLLSGLRSKYSPNFGCEIVEAAVVAGDDFLAEQGIQTVDFIKIDVEGAEPLVLRGLEKTIEGKRVSVVQIEHGHSEWQLKDYGRFFSDRGFVFGKVFPRYCDFSRNYSEFRQAVVSNYVAIRADRLDLLEAAAGVVSPKGVKA
jgi:FkbM family methyltransferase